MQGVMVDGGGVVSGGSASGSITTVSKDDNLVLSSEDSSSPDESELELALGLSVGGASSGLLKTHQALRGQYARILTAKDFPSMISSASSASSSSLSTSSSSSSSSSCLSRTNVTAGTKRSADSVAVTNGASQVVGWPPLRAHRMNSLISHAKSPATEEFNSAGEKNGCANTVSTKADNGSDKKNGNFMEKGHSRNSLFVKVNMDGIQIGRKVNLSAYDGYEALAWTLEDMFHGPATLVNSKRSSRLNQDIQVRGTGPSRLLDSSSEFVLTYEDKEGDWMLVGDVPWEMFISSVKRLRIMKTSEANGLSPRLQERNGRQRFNPV
ncbi:hypothetical protein FNV43_RR23177 [Rhamnella rubrinervis]|uniref:Auxin-responsive protein n=1 Tax=Rhamnella rubrinervis TaxID=2594499 RepID=A0A8K0DRT8_9ROSA|nr:hypothetical protein FNV43_RR23177 [Rhamnella rubrinervis]